MLDSPENMGKLVDSFFKKLSLPVIILLEGELGGGKTTFVQYFCKHLGVKEFVTSPTFNLLNIYQLNNSTSGDVKIYHIDLYRLKSSKEPQLEELFDIQEENYICLIEWPNLFNVNWSKLAGQLGATIQHLLFTYGAHEMQRIVEINSNRNK